MAESARQELPDLSSETDAALAVMQQRDRHPGLQPRRGEQGFFQAPAAVGRFREMQPPQALGWHYKEQLPVAPVQLE